jgi:hypothetical protein
MDVFASYLALMLEKLRLLNHLLQHRAPFAALEDERVNLIG